MVEKRKQEIKSNVKKSMEETYVVEFGPLRSWRLLFPEGETYWELVGACEEEKNLSALEGLANFFRDARTGSEKRLRDVSNFYIPFLIALLALLLAMMILKGTTPSLGLFLIIFFIFMGTMIVLLADEVGSNQKVHLFSLMYEYCVLLLLEKGRKEKATRSGRFNKRIPQEIIISFASAFWQCRMPAEAHRRCLTRGGSRQALFQTVRKCSCS